MTSAKPRRSPSRSRCARLSKNAGEDAAVVLNAVKAGKGAYGYNAANGEYGDMLEEGILDPTKVTRWRRRTLLRWPVCCSPRK